jgi:hypothetical protein
MNLIKGNATADPTQTTGTMTTTYRWTQGTASVVYDTYDPHLSLGASDGANYAFRGVVTLAMLIDLVDVLTAAKEQWLLIEAAKRKPMGSVI